MASDLDTWWPANYPTYSIRDLHSLPIFHRFLQLHYPYERTNPTSLESFLTSDSLDEFLTSDQDNQQKFTHNKREGIYTYSKKYKEKDCAVQVTSSIQGHMEWGTVQRVFDTWEVRETWKLTPPHREYEKITIEKDGKKGYKCGTKAKGEATERWLEETFESGEEATYRKTWETETGRGGETRNTKGGYSWGETWFNEGESSSEKKVWHEKDDKKWGEHSGKQGTETWNYRWEEEKDSKLEEKLTEKEGKMTGFRYNTKGAEWYRQEWEGAKAFPEALTVAPLSSTQFSRLTELYLQTEASVQASAHTLHLFLPSIPSNSSKIQSLDDRFLHIQSSDRSTFDLLLTRIDELHRLATDQESLKLAMWTEASTEWKLFEHFMLSLNEQATDSFNTLRKLADVVQMDSFETKLSTAKEDILATSARKSVNFTEQLQAWKSLFSSLESLKRDHFQYITQLVPEKDASLLRERSLRRQDLEDSVKQTYILLTRTHEFVSDLAMLAQDTETPEIIANLKKKYMEIYGKFVKKPGSEQAQELMEILKSYGAVQGKVLGKVRGDEVGGQMQEINAAADVARSMVPICLDTLRKMSSIGSLSSQHEELNDNARLLLETSGSDSQAAVMQAVQQWAELISRSLEKLQSSTEGGVEAITLLEPVTADLVQLVQESAASDSETLSRLSEIQQEAKVCFTELSTSPSDALAKRTVRLVRSLSLLLRSVGVKSGGVSPFSVFESLITDIHNSSLEENQGDLDAETQLFTLRTTIDTHYSELLLSPTRGNLSLVLNDVKEYQGLMLSAVLRAMEVFLPSVDRVVAAKPTDLQALREKLNPIWEAYKSEPRSWQFVVLKEALREYKLLLDAMKGPEQAPVRATPPATKPGPKKAGKK